MDPSGPTNTDLDWTDADEERAAGSPSAQRDDYQHPDLTATIAAEPSTVADIMALVHRYALARIAENASVPTKRQHDNPTIVRWHQEYRDKAANLEREIETTLIRAGLDTTSGGRR